LKIAFAYLLSLTREPIHYEALREVERGFSASVHRIARSVASMFSHRTFH